MIRIGVQVETGSRSAGGSTQTLPKAVLVAAVGLTIGFAMFMLSTIAGLQLGNTLLRPSPFIPYEAIWPGQTLESLEAYATGLPEGQIACMAGSAHSPGTPYTGETVYHIPENTPSTLSNTELVCSYQPASGLFRWVTVRIKNSRIAQLELLSDVLPEDVLLLYWGMPDAISRMGREQRLNLYWERGSYSAMATVMEVSSMVRIVTLTANS